MAEKNNIISVVSFMLLALMALLFAADLRYLFGNYDTPFFGVFALYTVYTLISRTTSRLTFLLVSLLLVSMGVAYLAFGPQRLTERIGEWLYLFFLFGLIQYYKEL